MRIETLPEEFIKAQPIIDTIEAAGYEAYYVGGFFQFSNPFGIFT